MASVLVSVTIPPGDLAKLQRVAVAVKDSGSKDLRRELEKGLRRSVRTMPKTFRAGALGWLPHRGGLAYEIGADLRFRSSVNVNPGRMRLRITGSARGPSGKARDLYKMNQGRLRHPVFGNRRVWVMQAIRPRWWDDAGIVAAQEAYGEIVKAVDVTAEHLKAQL